MRISVGPAASAGPSGVSRAISCVGLSGGVLATAGVWAWAGPAVSAKTHDNLGGPAHRYSCTERVPCDERHAQRFLRVKACRRHLCSSCSHFISLASRPSKHLTPQHDEQAQRQGWRHQCADSQRGFEPAIQWFHGHAACSIVRCEKVDVSARHFTIHLPNSRHVGPAHV